MRRVINLQTGEETTVPLTPQEQADVTRRAAEEQARQQSRRDEARDLDKAPAVVRDIMQALVLAGVLTAEQARTAYATAVGARQ